MENALDLIGDIPAHKHYTPRRAIVYLRSTLVGPLDASFWCIIGLLCPDPLFTLVDMVTFIQILLQLLHIDLDLFR